MAAANTNKDSKRMVEIQLFKDRDRYSDDLTVVVNGITYKIQRGVKVKVPYFVADVIEKSQLSDKMTSEKIEEIMNK